MTQQITLNSLPPIAVTWDIYRGDTAGLRLTFTSEGGPVPADALATLKASAWRLSFKGAGTVESHAWDGDTLVITVPSTITALLQRPMRGDLQQNTGSGVLTFATITGSLSGDVSPAGAVPLQETAARYHEITVDVVTRTVAGQVVVVTGGRGERGERGLAGVSVVGAGMEGGQLTLTLSDGVTLGPLPLPGLTDAEAAELQATMAALNTACDGKAEQSALSALATQLQALAGDVYTKAQISNLLGGKANSQTVASLTAAHNRLDDRVTLLEAAPEVDLTPYATTDSVLEGLSTKADTPTVIALTTRVTSLEAATQTLVTEVSELDSRLTGLESGEGPDLSTYATKDDLAAITGGAPETFDSFVESFQQFQAQGEVVSGIQSRLSTAEGSVSSLTTRMGQTESALTGKAAASDVTALSATVTTQGTELARVAGVADGNAATLGSVAASPSGNASVGAQLAEIFAGKADKTQLDALETSAHAAATYATKTLTDTLETSAHAAATFATKVQLGDYETSAHAASTYATQTSLSSYETSAHATSTYATQATTGALTDLNAGITGTSRNNIIAALNAIWNRIVTALSGLTDVAISSPTNGQILTFNGTTQKWYNAAAPSSGGTGNVTGPASSTVGGVPTFGNTTGTSIAASMLTIATGGYIQTTGLGTANTVGNARGSSAIDLQGTRNNANQVASSTGSAILSGMYNRASATGSIVVGGNSNWAGGYGYSTVLGGQNNTTSGSYQTASGYNALARKEGERAHGSFGFTASGDAQDTRVMLGRQTTDATLTELFTDLSASRLTVVTNQAIGFSGMIVANTPTATETACWEIKGCIRNRAGTAELVGTPSVTVIAASSGATGWTLSLSADNVNKSLKFTVGGAAGVTIRWVANNGLTENGA